MIAQRTARFSKNILLQEVGNNTFAAIHRQGGLAISNAGLVNLGDCLVCFDALLSPLAAADLNLIAESLFNRSIDFLVFSHYHSDHTWGSQAFPPEIDVIASNQVRSLIETAGQEEIRHYRDDSEEMQKALQALQSKSRSQAEEQKSLLWQDFLRATLDSCTRARVRTVTLTFGDQLNLYGSRTRVSLFQARGGHTAFDTMMFVPSSGVLFTGDLVTIQCHPYLAESMPGGFAAALNVILEIAPRVIVPGHGPVGTLEDVHTMVSYLEELKRLASRIQASGKNLDLAKPVDIPQKFHGWDFDNYFQDNLRFVMKYLE